MAQDALNEGRTKGYFYTRRLAIPKQVMSPGSRKIALRYHGPQDGDQNLSTTKSKQVTSTRIPGRAYLE